MFETVVYSPLFGIVLSIAAFEAGIWIQKKTRKAICNPLVIAILLCIAVLVLFDIPLEAYNKGGDIINLFLGPATAVLALNIYNQMDVLKKHFWPVLAGCTAGSITSIGSVFPVSYTHLDVYKRQLLLQPCKVHQQMDFFTPGHHGDRQPPVLLLTPFWGGSPNASARMFKNFLDGPGRLGIHRLYTVSLYTKKITPAAGQQLRG